MMDKDPRLTMFCFRYRLCGAPHCSTFARVLAGMSEERHCWIDHTSRWPKSPVGQGFELLQSWEQKNWLRARETPPESPDDPLWLLPTSRTATMPCRRLGTVLEGLNTTSQFCFVRGRQRGDHRVRIPKNGLKNSGSLRMYMLRRRCIDPTPW